MITKEELSEVKQKRRTSLYYEEKEYLQYIFLEEISRLSDNFTFKGGTCLRICYGLERASEDLDFNTNLSLKELKETINKCLNKFYLLNIKYEILSIKEFEGNLRFEIRFQGPLYAGNKNSTNTLKIDFNKKKIKNKKAKVVQKLFSDIPLFTILVLSEEEILAEKIRALSMRSEPKDLYDIWILINKGIKIDKALVNSKLKEEMSHIENIKIIPKEEYNKTLSPLLSNLPNYEQVKNEVESLIKKEFIKQ